MQARCRRHGVKLETSVRPKAVASATVARAVKAATARSARKAASPSSPRRSSTATTTKRLREERSHAAIHLDCFASLAMTANEKAPLQGITAGLFYNAPLLGQ